MREKRPKKTVFNGTQMTQKTLPPCPSLYGGE